eukprot:6180344-Pleurochrysis_carterae.AAC.3
MTQRTSRCYLVSCAWALSCEGHPGMRWIAFCNQLNRLYQNLGQKAVNSAQRSGNTQMDSASQEQSVHESLRLESIRENESNQQSNKVSQTAAPSIKRTAI